MAKGATQQEGMRKPCSDQPRSAVAVPGPTDRTPTARPNTVTLRDLTQTHATSLTPAVSHFGDPSHAEIVRLQRSSGAFNTCARHGSFRRPTIQSTTVSETVALRRSVKVRDNPEYPPSHFLFRNEAKGEKLSLLLDILGVLLRSRHEASGLGWRGCLRGVGEWVRVFVRST